MKWVNDEWINLPIHYPGDHNTRAGRGWIQELDQVTHNSDEDVLSRFTDHYQGAWLGKSSWDMNHYSCGMPVLHAAALPTMPQYQSCLVFFSSQLISLILRHLSALSLGESCSFPLEQLPDYKLHFIDWNCLPLCILPHGDVLPTAFLIITHSWYTINSWTEGVVWDKVTCM